MYTQSAPNIDRILVKMYRVWLSLPSEEQGSRGSIRWLDPLFTVGWLPIGLEGQGKRVEILGKIVWLSRSVDKFGAELGIKIRVFLGQQDATSPQRVGVEGIFLLFWQVER